MLIQKQYAVIVPNTFLPEGTYYPSDLNALDAQEGAGWLTAVYNSRHWC
jgi:hypothetical protein